MTDDAVAWSLTATGGHRYTYLVHGRLIGLKHNDSPWIVADHMSAQAAHDAAVASTSQQKNATITRGPVSFVMASAQAKVLRETGAIDEDLSLLIAAHLATEKADLTTASR